MRQNAKRKTGELIDQNLRRAFQEVADEELPDRFKDLLARLKAGEDVPTSDDEGPGE
jgi:hypothetical protein